MTILSPNLMGTMERSQEEIITPKSCYKKKSRTHERKKVVSWSRVEAESCAIVEII